MMRSSAAKRITNTLRRLLAHGDSVAEESEDATVRGSVRGCMGFAPGAPRRGGVSFAKRRAARPLRIVSRLVGACGLCGWSAFGTLRTVAYPAARTPASTWFSAAKGEPRPRIRFLELYEALGIDEVILLCAVGPAQHQEVLRPPSLRRDSALLGQRDARSGGVT